MLIKQLQQTLIFISCLVSISCTSTDTGVDIEAVSESRALALDKAFATLISKHKINTAGVAVIKNGALVWQKQYGQQSPGVPASESTRFNVASVTKTVTAETILRLIADGRLSLDEAMTAYWLDPDLGDDPNHHKLTPRMALTHTTGFMNWRFFSDDNKLKFINAPGTTFEYSGEGFKYLAKYAETKLDTPFETLVNQYVFAPLAINSAAISVKPENYQSIAQPLDKDGVFHGYYCYPEGYCRPEGEYSAAGDMVITISDYAKFLISSMRGDMLSSSLVNERNTLHSVQFKAAEIDCSMTPEALCPLQQGYGLGWNITQLEHDIVIGHRGTDWSMVTLAYYYQHSRDGLIIFLNAPNKAGLAGMVDALELLDPESAEIHAYKARRDRADG